MIESHILSPEVNHLLCRVRHAHALVIAERGFPAWPALETVDLATEEGPTVLQVLGAIRPNFKIGQVILARAFRDYNLLTTQARFGQALAGLRMTEAPNENFLTQASQAVGVIRTGDATRYANLIVISA